MSQHTRQANRERGSATIEAVIGVPAFLLFVLLIIAAGRLAMARHAVEASAAEAARSASIFRTQARAEADGVSGAATSLRNQGVRCASQRVDIDTSGFAAPVGTPAKVTATPRQRVTGMYQRMRRRGSQLRSRRASRRALMPTAKPSSLSAERPRRP